MTLAEIQSFKKTGWQLRIAREKKSLSLKKISDLSGIGIEELVRIENGELMGFKQSPQSTLKNAELYSKALGLQFVNSSQQQTVSLKPSTQNNEFLIPAFLRKNTD